MSEQQQLDSTPDLDEDVDQGDHQLEQKQPVQRPEGEHDDRSEPERLHRTSPGGGIRELHLHNFKSWGGTQVIGPFKTFSCVIGSNGSGKSNLMDAISFVLGVRTQDLRGQRLRDLVHRGAAPQTPENLHAYVELVYDHGDGASTTFKRAISGDKALYLIDGNAVSWKQYEERLRSFGVIVRARNFLVFQGDVESIASKSPMQMTELFEQISGSEQLREEYDRLSETAKEAETSFMRLFDKKRSVTKEKRLIKEQKEEALRFQSMQQDYKRLQQQFFLWQFFQIDTELKHHEDRIRELHEESQSKKNRCTEAEANLMEASQLYGRLRRQRTAMDKELNKLTRKTETERTNMIKLEEHCSHLKYSLCRTEDAYEKAKVDDVQHAELIESLKSELQTVEGLVDDLERGIQADESEELKMEEAQLQEYEKCKKKAAEATAGLRQYRDVLRNELRSDQATVEEMEARFESLMTHKEQLLESRTKCRSKQDKMEAHIGESEGRVEGLQASLDQTKLDQEQTAKSRSELNQQLVQIERELLGVRVERFESEREARLSEAIVAMQRLYPGVKGRLSSLARPTQRRYHVAVSTALGKNMNAIVVDTRKTGLECIRYLKEQRVGTATFLPLDSLNVQSSSSVADSYRRFGDKVKLVSDVIQTEEAYLQAVAFACSDTLVADTMNDARKVAFGCGSSGKRSKVVTLDGDLLHKSGNMSGGAQRDRKDGISAFDRQKMTETKARKDELVQKLAKLDSPHQLRTKEQDLQSQLSGLQSNIRYSRQDLKLTKEKLAKISKSIDDVERDMNSISPQLKQLKIKLVRKESELETAEQKIAEKEDAIFSAFSRRVGVSSIREYEEQRLALVKEHADQKLQLANQLSRLKNQIEYQQKRGKAGRIAALEKELADDRTQLCEIQAVIRDTEKKIQTLQQQSAAKQDTLQNVKLEVEETAARIKALKDDLAMCQDDYASAQSHITGLEGDMAKLRQSRTDLMQTCRLEHIDIPIVGAGNSHRSRTSGRRSRKRISRSQDNEDGEDESSDRMELESGAPDDADRNADESEAQVVDYSTLIDQSELEGEEFAKKKQALLDDLTRLSADLEGMNPNLKAIQRFSEVKERMQSMMDSFDDAKQKTKAAQDAFGAVRQTRIDKFMSAFNHVSGTIDKIYKQLTQSQEFPLGGNAFLSLESVDEPFTSGIKYSAMPPMKRFRDIDQLSGGEKTVAALALLFAIHSYHPSPFFVLDEVDAALDRANVTKVARFVRCRAHEDNLQCVVISLKDTFFDKADALVGVFKDHKSASSNSMTLDLTKYDR